MISLLYASRQHSLKCIHGNHGRKQQLRHHRRCNRRSRSWDKWQMAGSPEAHRRPGIIQSLYLLVFQRSHSRFNSRYVYCHSVVIFPLKFPLGNKKLWREWNTAIGRLHTVARGSIALNKFALRDRTTIRYPAILFTIKKRSSLQIKLPTGLRFFSQPPALCLVVFLVE